MRTLLLHDVEALLTDLEAEFDGHVLVAGPGDGSTNSCSNCTGGCGDQDV